MEGGKFVNSEFGLRNTEKSLRPQRLSGEKDLPQRRRDAEGLVSPDGLGVDGGEWGDKLRI